MNQGETLKNSLLTCLALLAFAGNSILCRYALKGDAIDAASFTSIRLISGVVFLVAIVLFQHRGKYDFKAGSWSSSWYLFVYMVAFSFAYINLDTGVGALILFGFVQVTMVLMSLIKGHRLLLIEWAGLIIAFLGLALLLLPSASAPSLLGFVVMAISGIAWGFYSLAGKGVSNPTLFTANNFLRTTPLLLVLLILCFETVNITQQGILLAVLSGTLTSGLGYAIWYAALNGLSITQAAVLQLTVPIIATFGGVLFSNETITTQLIISSIFVLGGILVVILGKRMLASQ